MLSLVLSIILPLIFGGALSLLAFLFWVNTKNADSTNRGTILFMLDIKQRRILPHSRDSNKIYNRHIFKATKLGTWMPLSFLTKNFVGTAGEKTFRNAFNDALTNEVVQKHFTTEGVDKKKKLRFNIKITKIEGLPEHFMEIAWTTDEKEKESIITKNHLTKMEVASNSSKFKGFIAFSLNYSLPYVENTFTEIYAKVFNKKHVSLFFAGGLVCVPIFGNNNKRVIKTMKKNIKIVLSKGNRRGMNRLFIGSAQIVSEDINSPRRVNSVLKALDYLINLSIIHKDTFISKDHKMFNSEDYKVFAESSQKFRLAVRSGDVETKTIPVRNYVTKKKVVEYAFPVIPDITEPQLALILKNNYKRSQLLNAHAHEIAIECTSKQPLLIDVNANWLFENKDKFKFNKAIYVINFRYREAITSELIKAIDDLKKAGFIFAMRLAEYNEHISTVIMNVDPHFIVVDKNLSSDIKPVNLIQLISIKKIADHEKIKLIFENPSKDIDKKWIDKIGIKFYYEFN